MTAGFFLSFWLAYIQKPLSYYFLLPDSISANPNVKGKKGFKLVSAVFFMKLQ